MTTLNAPSAEPSHHLVLTAIGQDKTGLVSELSGLVSQCHCNILDSKMAIFGSEFTMIMLLAGNNTALLQLETRLPELALKLDLLTMMKRTTAHNGIDKSQYLLQLEGPDQPGTIKKLTSYFAGLGIAISSLRSKTLMKDQTSWQSAEINLELPDGLSFEAFQQGCNEVSQQLNMNCAYHPITIEQEQ